MAKRELYLSDEENAALTVLLALDKATTYEFDLPTFAMKLASMHCKFSINICSASEENGIKVYHSVSPPDGDESFFTEVQFHWEDIASEFFEYDEIKPSLTFQKIAERLQDFIPVDIEGKQYTCTTEYVG